MRNIKLVIEYDGSRYDGWQRLKDSEQTIQGKIEKVLNEMTGSSVEIIGSGRTDAGVHAKNQIANFKTKSSMSIRDIHNYMNHYLPQDIVVKEVKEVSDRFHSRYNAQQKKYTYYVWNHRIPSAFQRKYSYYFPETLDLQRMEAAANQLLGTHDFIGFSSVKKAKKSTVRTIEGITIVQNNHMLEFSFIGDGFLHNMIRILMGTLLEIGTREKDISCIDEIFTSKTRAMAGKTAPSQGLFLEEVYY